MARSVGTAGPGDPRLPVYARLRDDLAARIGAQEWRPDNAIPSENKLADEYGVAVGTLRRAIELLVHEGLLERRRGSGTFVRRPAFDADLFRFFHVVEGGEGKRVIPESRILQRTKVEAPAPVVRALGVRYSIRVDRLRLWHGEPLLSEELHLDPERFPGFESVDLSESGPLLYPVFEHLYGVIISSATDEVSLGTADAAHARLLRVEEGSPVAVIHRVARDQTGCAVEWRRVFGRGDRFRYRIDIQ